MSRVGVKFMLNYHRNNLEYKRAEDEISYKNWILIGVDGTYVIEFMSEEFLWVIKFNSKRIIDCSYGGLLLNSRDPHLIKKLCSMDLLGIHRYMIDRHN
jgi:hypothetical protein